MSKSKGNAVDPFDALRNMEQMRSAGISTSTVHRGCRTVSTEKQLQEGQRKFMGTLWNTYAFLCLYANIDEFDATKYT